MSCEVNKLISKCTPQVVREMRKLYRYNEERDQVNSTNTAVKLRKSVHWALFGPLQKISTIDLELRDRFHQKVEDTLKERIYPDLENGRPGFDAPHTEATVMYLKELLAHDRPDVDHIVLLIAAYGHDWGYSNLFKSGVPAQLPDVMANKAAHAIYGAKKMRSFLSDPFFNFLTDKQKDRIFQLILVHDDYFSLTATDEKYLMMADTLGAVDCINVRPTFNYKYNQIYMQKVRDERRRCFTSEYGVKKLDILLSIRERYYKGLHLIQFYKPPFKPS